MNLSVVAGEKVGVLGKLESGKSTLLYSIIRLVDLNSGIIALDGVSVEHLDPREIRGQVGYISVNPYLFNGTLRDNIDPYRRHSDEEVEDVFSKLDLRWILKKHNSGLNTTFESCESDLNLEQ